MKALTLGLLLTSTTTSFASAIYSCSAPAGNVKKAFEYVQNSGNNEQLEQLLRSNNIPKTARNKFCRTLYHRAISTQNESLRAMLDNLGYGPLTADEINIDSEGLMLSYYQFALINGSVETIKDLKARGGAIVHPHQNDLSWASYSQSEEVISYLIESGADVNFIDNEGYTPLFLAAKGNSVNVVKMLVEAGADITFKRKSDKTDALSLAVTFNNDLEVTKYLVKQFSDINSIRWHYTPLTAAALSKKPIEKMDTLLKAGANVNAKNRNGNTALLTAAFSTDSKVIDYLIAAGAHINIQNSEGTTALMRAAASKRKNAPQIITTLVKLGADKKVKNKAGLTAYDIGKANNLNADFLKLLK